MTEKKICISFNEDTSREDNFEGSILLSGVPEKFIASLTSFSMTSYQKQWSDAIRMVKYDRKPSALFTNVDLGDDGIGWLWIYTLIPSDELELEGQSEKGVYITNSFYPVCTNPSSFLKRSFLEYEDGTKGDELAFYFLDLQHPERFFGYLDTAICERSYWFLADADI